MSSAGSAYIFELQSGVWTEVAKITASDKQSADYFGYSVSISGDGETVIVGAYLEDPSGLSSAGSAYIFELQSGAWTQVAKISASDKGLGDNFGSSVSISGDGTTAIVGAIIKDIAPHTNAGAAYIFEKGSGWANGISNQVARLTASDFQAADYFGSSVSISDDGTTAIVGAYFEDADGVWDAGSAYIFELQSGVWTQVVKITSSDKERFDRFGYSVSISGDGTTAIVGAYAADVQTLSASGAAYVFAKGSGWANGSSNQVSKITASDKNEDYYFGHSVSISGDGATAIVGSYLNASMAVDAGSAYIFDTREIEIIYPTSPTFLDNFFYPEPTSEVITGVLSASEEGVIQIQVDPGDKLKQNIDMRERSTIGKNK